MKWLVIGIIILLLFILFILLSKIKLKVTFLYSEMEKKCLLQVKIWMIRYTFDVLERIEKQQKKTGQKIEKAEEDGGLDNKIMAQLDSIGELIKKLQEVHTIVKDFLKRVKINGWKWHTQIGAGDAASTGIVTGYAWGQKVWLLELSDNICILSTYQNLKLPQFFKEKDLHQDVS